MFNTLDSTGREVTLKKGDVVACFDVGFELNGVISGFRAVAPYGKMLAIDPQLVHPQDVSVWPLDTDSPDVEMDPDFEVPVDTAGQATEKVYGPPFTIEAEVHEGLPPILRATAAGDDPNADGYLQIKLSTPATSTFFFVFYRRRVRS